MDAVICDGGFIGDAEEVRDGGRSLFIEFVELEDPVVEVRWIRGIGPSSGRLEGRDSPVSRYVWRVARHGAG